MESKNLKLGYLLIALSNTYLWFAVWLLYILKYIDISQATALQAIGLASSLLSEVPTGAISDLFGKKRTLHIAFLLTGIGEIFMATSTTFPRFVVAWIFMNVGYSFYSGTMEAFMYDTLVSSNEEDKYPQVVSRMNMAMNAAIGVASITGGFMFRLWPGLPFLATGLIKFVGLFISFFLTEPKVDTDTFSFSNFIQQNKKGFTHLFQASMLKYTALVLLFGVFANIAYEILDDVSVVDWGFNEIQIGMIYAAATFLAIPAGYLYPRLSKKFRTSVLVAGSIVFLILGYLFSPWITAPVWIVLFFVRVFYSPIQDSSVSESLNKNTSSNIRATTISTYELVRKIPYIFLAGYIGIAMQSWGVKMFAHYFALVLLVLLGVYVVVRKASDRKKVMAR